MTLFDYYLQYMTELWEGKRPAPEGVTLPEGGDESARIQALGQQLQAMGMANFVRACAAQDGTALPEEGLDILHRSSTGKLQTLILRGREEDNLAWLEKLHPLFMDSVPLTLEEIFIYELGGADYAVRDIVL